MSTTSEAVVLSCGNTLLRGC